MESFTLGSDRVLISTKIKDENGLPLNLEGAEVTYWLWNPQGVMSELPGIVSNPLLGECKIELTTFDIPMVGMYQYRVIVNLANRTFPSFKKNFQVVN